MALFDVVSHNVLRGWMPFRGHLRADDLAALRGQTAYLRFAVHYTADSGVTYFLDDVSLAAADVHTQARAAAGCPRRRRLASARPPAAQPGEPGRADGRPSRHRRHQADGDRHRALPRAAPSPLVARRLGDRRRRRRPLPARCRRRGNLEGAHLAAERDPARRYRPPRGFRHARSRREAARYPASRPAASTRARRSIR